MGIWLAPQVTADMDIDQLRNLVAFLIKDVEDIINGGIDSKNAREFGGYQVDQENLRSKDGMVGLSTSGTDPTSIRIWAGNAVPAVAPYQVWQDGTVKSTRGYIGGWVIGSDSLTDTAGTVGFSTAVTAGDDIRIWAGNADPTQAPFQVTEAGNVTVVGGTIRTGPVNAQRIELSGGSFKGYTAANQYSGLVFDPNKTNDIVDLFLYHSGNKLLEFFDGIDYYAIRGTSSSNKMELGGTGASTYAKGIWNFSLASSITGIPESAITGLSSDLNSIFSELSDHESRISALESPSP